MLHRAQPGSRRQSCTWRGAISCSRCRPAVKLLWGVNPGQQPSHRVALPLPGEASPSSPAGSRGPPHTGLPAIPAPSFLISLPKPLFSHPESPHNSSTVPASWVTPITTTATSIHPAAPKQQTHSCEPVSRADTTGRPPHPSLTLPSSAPRAAAAVGASGI